MLNRNTPPTPNRLSHSAVDPDLNTAASLSIVDYLLRNKFISDAPLLLSTWSPGLLTLKIDQMTTPRLLLKVTINM